jgi:hypothetical protein
VPSTILLRRSSGTFSGHLVFSVLSDHSAAQKLRHLFRASRFFSSIRPFCCAEAQAPFQGISFFQFYQTILLRRSASTFSGHLVFSVLSDHSAAQKLRNLFRASRFFSSIRPFCCAEAQAPFQGISFFQFYQTILLRRSASTFSGHLVFSVLSDHSAAQKRKHLFASHHLIS